MSDSKPYFFHITWSKVFYFFQGGEGLMNRKWFIVIIMLSAPGILSANMGISQIEDSITAQYSTSSRSIIENTAFDSEEPNWLKKSEDNSNEYLVHDGYFYFPVEEDLTETNIDKVLGTVSRIGEWEEFKEGDTPYFLPGSIYYTIKSVPDKNKIAIEIVKNETKKYQVLEKGHPVPK
ncbi:hypothetical protein [Brevibacillus porteri]|uniref:Uncharacterized protein n=2 Tax=Brevibacillus porteri TaxID=2126350 RepID=A0ABX5FI45_9BACL|nr:hypothetical protein [Brevibacillus porteri]MED1797488.1 hypothetical protein [Brevibacillus porteri]MED2130772.1 hypothetical protein [Brevibacillus porteri]MED2895014.1 hypothetical protein [Brevibacillus porteri]PSK03596.1 hypothetical protein C7R92_27770 [Brevibacillus porteri]